MAMNDIWATMRHDINNILDWGVIGRKTMVVEMLDKNPSSTSILQWIEKVGHLVFDQKTSISLQPSVRSFSLRLLPLMISLD
jgi:hypothetical protein